MRTGNARPPGWVRRQHVAAALAKKQLQKQGRLSEQPKGKTEQERFTERYARDLIGFCERVLGMKPWRGINGKDGQYEVLEAIQDSVCRQLDGEQNVPFIFVVEAGHGVGKHTGWKRQLSRGFTAASSPPLSNPPPTPMTRCATRFGKTSVPTSPTPNCAAATSCLG